MVTKELKGNIPGTFIMSGRIDWMSPHLLASKENIFQKLKRIYMLKHLWDYGRGLDRSDHVSCIKIQPVSFCDQG